MVSSLEEFQAGLILGLAGGIVVVVQNDMTIVLESKAANVI